MFIYIFMGEMCMWEFWESWWRVINKCTERYIPCWWRLTVCYVTRSDSSEHTCTKHVIPLGDARPRWTLVWLVRDANGIKPAPPSSPQLRTQGCHCEWSWMILSDLAKYFITRIIARPLCCGWASCFLFGSLQCTKLYTNQLLSIRFVYCMMYRIVSIKLEQQQIKIIDNFFSKRSIVL